MTSKIQQTVMNRVHTIHAVRPLVSGGALAAALSLGSLYFIGREVWVAKVFANMPNPTHIVSVARFFMAAFFNTRSIVQALVLLALVAFVWLAREIARSIPTLRLA